MPSAHGFDGQAFFDAVDKRRRDQQLSWPALATAIWEQSRVLNERGNDHPISPATIRKAAGGLSCQHALFVLRWLCGRGSSTRWRGAATPAGGLISRKPLPFKLPAPPWL